MTQALAEPLTPPPEARPAARIAARENNFDLVRILAALQVALFHASAHMKVPPEGVWAHLAEVLRVFPGVPIFFVVSGFLISASYERNPDLRSYFRARLLRIYPALWVCLAISLAVAGAFGFLPPDVVLSPHFAAWLAGQITLVQFYNPPFLRGFGVGVLNGSLWTIPVELTFYVCVPALYGALVHGRARRTSNALLGLVALASFAVGYAMSTGAFDPPEAMRTKLVQVTLAPHLYMFLLGVLAQRNWDVVERLLRGRFLLWIVLYTALALALRQEILGGPLLTALARVMLAATVLSGAFSAPWLSARALRHQDISYGFYLYHMVIINVLVELGLVGRPSYVLAALGVAVIAAFASWRLVEKPALARKGGRPAKREEHARAAP
ncbi:acyltransferase family protein [Sorangium sp. So ce131]|uniref:acyltransferase family protein n=1 Tax=Sorangium sp. So ce131 TaxID=3133282 RepID=UPI003F5EFB75